MDKFRLQKRNIITNDKHMLTVEIEPRRDASARASRIESFDRRPMSSVLNPPALRQASLPQFFRYLGRYVRHHPSTTRVVPPVTTLRAPTEPGAGLFFFPADSWTKTRAVAVGPLGETESTIHPARFEISRGVATADPSPTIEYWGVGGAVRMVKNIASGVTEGFAVNLELQGVGYRAEVDEKRNKLVLRLGLSHTVEFPMKQGDVFFKVVNPQLVQVAGINREEVHQVAATVRSKRKPEPYKGKGIRYQDEPVRRKESKKDS